ncbi:TrmH family RNA methyltransferase [Flavobacterium lacus]|uniref:TrmH family RNA methyltransferase n=1 Tax=Flavobacterium lacus TaxID=1353778 RepID=A0A328X4N7_9FLAO|nr:RNA methyltransferase [Flavobacterium lacus]RAR50259.1 TrmH family RNA methyltransferase [Flavobacterium lacus]
MVSKNQIKRITGLHQKKFRNEQQLFIAEGIKVIQELYNSSFEIQEFYSTDSSLQLNNKVKPDIISETDLKKISCLKTPNTCLAVFKIAPSKPIKYEGLTLVLDDIRDPGNLGTIIRLCDWFGIEQLICSEETADLYNPKVIQATMGSIARVNVVYTSLERFLKNTKQPIYGAFMDGDVVYETELPTTAVLVMGNEANGVTATVEALIQKKISIPRFGKLQKTESLNVATATAILLSEFRKNLSGK